MILILESNSVQVGCDKHGITRMTFYRWLKRLRENNFDITSLKDQSRRPKNSPCKTSEENEKLVLEMNAEHGNSDRLLAIEFINRTGKKIAHSTVCKIVKRNGLAKKYRCIKPNTFNRRYIPPRRFL